MSLVCAQCSRVNPPEAAYCYHDGAALAGRGAGPINPGSAPFPTQFVFPNGTACRNFDQLAMACQQNWAAAIDLLKQGFFNSFFGGLGRVDLAMAAQEAAKFPDIDRGLDQLLSKLPTQALQPPKLQAEPTEINLGQLAIGQDRTTELHLSNQGMRLLYGNVTSDCRWLTLGEGAGQPEKIFQFGSEAVMHVQVRGQHLRAGSKPLEGHLVVECNGGTATVTVRADVPIAPFPDGPFAGATTPRQIAEKAKANPKEAASYFESGAIAKWYASNGWNYPVQGPTMPGMGAIQQFFEALGVAKPPKIEFSTKAIELQGSVGQTVQGTIEVTTQERKVVYGWATCDQGWVEIGKTKVTGKNAIIPITVRIPSPAPPSLEASINVIGNGNQKSTVPLRVTVSGGKQGVVVQQPAVDVELVGGGAPAGQSSPFSFQQPNPPAPQDDNPFAGVQAPSTPGAAPDQVVAPPPAGAGMPLALRLVVLLLPIALLCTCLLGLIIRDVLPPNWGGPPLKGQQKRSDAGEDSSTLLALDPDLIDSKPHVRVQFDEGRFKDKPEYADSMNFAVHKVSPNIKLNWYPNGMGNSVLVRIDGKDYVQGHEASGRWAGEAKPADKYGGKTRTFEYGKAILSVTQTVILAPGEPPPGPGEPKYPLSLVLARYKIHNKDRLPHKVGFRVLVDTCVGDEDGVPFTLPGVKELVNTSRDFRGKEVPDFIQVLQKPDLQNPGIVLQLNLRINDKLELPNRFLLTRWPAKDTNDFAFLRKWDVKVTDIKDDSCVVMYWDEKKMEPGETREVGYTYGVGSVDASASLSRDRQLGLSVGGAMQRGGELSVVAMITDSKGSSVTLKLPEGLKLLDGELTQTVPPSRAGLDGKSRPVPVTWRVQATDAGRHTIEVNTDSGMRQARRVVIPIKSLFN